ERTQPGMSSRLYAEGGVLVPSEHHIGAFHTWVNERLGGGRPPGQRTGRGAQPR
ncbi:SRPBCC family protein, partial [Streptomyces sp. NPDC048481]|uniref:SRPBCC family protein n=1 Tax=Streptomyces sp. NPDC048481 TaxID=3365557 RepID=UPI003719486F